MVDNSLQPAVSVSETYAEFASSLKSDKIPPTVRTVRVAYRIDPMDEYPRNYSGHVGATLRDGSVLEARQPHLRGGVREPLDRSELVDKFRANLAFGGISQKHAGEIEDALSGLFDAPNMSRLSACRLEE